MGGRKRRSVGERRLARLVDAGLVKKREFKRSAGKLTNASSAKLRRLDKKLGKYLRSADYTIYRPKSKRESRALAHLLPHELAKLKLAAVPIRVETRSTGTAVVKNRLRGVRVLKDGTVRVQTDGPAYYFPKLSRAELLDPKKAAKRLKKYGGAQRYLRTRTGFSTLNQMHRLDRDPAGQIRQAIAVFRAYSREPKPGETFAVTGPDFVEGFMIEDRTPRGSRAKKTGKARRGNRRRN